MKIEKLKQLNTLLGAEIILTGSCALAYHGLLTMDEAKDLDVLILNVTPTTQEVLNRLQKDSPSPKWKEGSTKWNSFMYDGIKVDVWFIDKHEDKNYLVTPDGVKVASILSIINAKKAYNRPKDWVQLMLIAKRIFDMAEFKNNLSTIASKSDDDYETEA